MEISPFSSMGTFVPEVVVEDAPDISYNMSDTERIFPRRILKVAVQFDEYDTSWLLKANVFTMITMGLY